eukprot:gene16248-17889_t
MVREGHNNVIRTVRNYEDAVRALNSLQTNAAVLDQIRKERGNRTMLNSIPAMERFMTRINVKVADLDKLNVIHVSGTKGKGSTCAFSESILRQCGLKTGFYSSPHLVEVRERIRINGKPLEKDKFVEYFWHCMDGLQSTVINYDGEMPAYFRFLTLLAYYVFLQEQVDVAIIEVGIGGRHDCTNVVRNPVVSGIAMLGIEHTSALGDTIEKIAWHKAGIIKKNRPAFTLPQVPEAITVFKEREQEMRAKLMVAPPLETYENDFPALGIEGHHQLYNASLALQLCKTWFSEKKEFVMSKGITNVFEGVEESDELTIDEETGLPLASPFFIPQLFMEGIRNVKWPGRSQVAKRKNITFYIDGAHTAESMKACSDWFSMRKDRDVSFRREDVFRVLVFNSTGGRDAHTLLKPLLNIDFDYAVFCPNIVESDNRAGSSDQTNFTVTRDKQLAWCIQNQLAWLASKGLGIPSTTSSIDLTSSHLSGTSLQESECSAVFSNISDALKWIAAGKDSLIDKPRLGGPKVPSRLALSEHIQVVVTGSLHLVGGVMRFLGPEIVDVF